MQASYRPPTAVSLCTQAKQQNNRRESWRDVRFMHLSHEQEPREDAADNGPRNEAAPALFAAFRVVEVCERMAAARRVRKLEDRPEEGRKVVVVA